MLYSTHKACRNEGIPVNDPEYGSAIGWAVFKAIRTHDPTKPNAAKLQNLCVVYALRACANVRRDLEADHRSDLRGADRGIRQPPTPLPIPLRDFDLLSFVAAHNIAKAAKMLGVTAYHLKKILLEIQLRVREGVALAEEPPTFGLGELGEDDNETPGMSFHNPLQ